MLVFSLHYYQGTGVMHWEGSSQAVMRAMGTMWKNMCTLMKKTHVKDQSFQLICKVHSLPLHRLTEKHNNHVLLQMRRRRKSRMRLQHSQGEMEDVGEQIDHDMFHWMVQMQPHLHLEGVDETSKTARNNALQLNFYTFTCYIYSCLLVTL